MTAHDSTLHTPPFDAVAASPPRRRRRSSSSASATKRSPSPRILLSGAPDSKGGVQNITRKVIRKLEELGTPGTWNHITDQIGMFSFTGLTEAQVLKLRQEFHVYMTKNGRISMAGLNTRNVEYFAKAVDKVVRDSS